MAETKKGDYEEVPQKEKKIEQMAEEVIELKPTLGLIQGCTIIIGSIIGSGIFIAPGGVLIGTGSINLALCIWLSSGVFSMIGAYCYAELGCMIRKPGGDYTYILDTLGPFVGFLRLWAECLIVRPCTITIVALTFAKYASKPFFPECEPPDEGVRLLAAMCICKEKEERQITQRNAPYVYSMCCVLNARNRCVETRVSGVTFSK